MNFPECFPFFIFQRLLTFSPKTLKNTFKVADLFFAFETRIIFQIAKKKAQKGEKVSTTIYNEKKTLTSFFYVFFVLISELNYQNC